MTPPPAPRRRPSLAPAPSSRQLREHPAVRNYTLFCLAALFLLVMCLVDRGLGWWCLMPALIGGVALLASWSLGPPLLILSLTALMLSGTRYRWGYPYWARNQVPTLMDFVLCAAVLAYVMGHYRLLSLMRHVFPTDHRQPRGGASSDPTRRRSADLVGAREMALLMLALPLWTGMSVMVWGWMMETGPALGMSIEVWRTLRVVWVVLAVLATAGTVAGYIRLTTATPEEALVYLQDQLWRWTRREQGSLNRWLTWARLRPAKEETMMRFWWRELGGWFLIGLGLLCFGIVWRFCRQQLLVESLPMAFIGMILFWGGIHLLKVAIAARVCQQAQDQLYPSNGWRVEGGGWREKKHPPPSTLHPPPV